MRLIYEEQSRQMELRLLMQKEHYEKLTDALEEASRTRHDFRQYIRTASILLEPLLNICTLYLFAPAVTHSNVRLHLQSKNGKTSDQY